MTSADPARPASPRLALASIALIIVLCAAVLALALLLYRVPLNFFGKWGLYRDGATVTAGAVLFEHDRPPLPVAPFVWMFRALLVTAWMSWGSLVVRGFQRRVAPRQFVVGISFALIAALAVCAPAVLSNDLFTYSRYARLYYTHELNPYVAVHGAMLSASAQNSGLQGSPLPYGPLWLLIASRFSAIGVAAGFPFEILAHKLLAGAALLATALAGARLAERREAGRGPLTFIAIAFNPLLLLEGPIAGHNDMLMMAFIVVGASLYAAEHRRWAPLVLGLAAAVKLTALAVLPPLLFDEWQSRASPSRASRAILTTLLVAAPFVLLSLPFGGPRLLFGDALAQSEAAQYHVPLFAETIVLGGGLIWSWSLVRGSLIPSAWLTGAIPIALAAIVAGGVLWFPWHLMWALVPALTAWDERHRSLNVALTSGAVVLTLLYSVP